MILKDFMPDPSVRAFVRCYRIVHMRFDAQNPPPFKPYTPRPEQCLAFYPHDRERVDFTKNNQSIANIPVALVGQALAVTNRHIGGNFMVVQILFQPGGLHRLTGLPCQQINDCYLPADTLFKQDIHFVNEAFFHANTYAEIVQIANGFINQLAQKAKVESHIIDLVCAKMMNSTSITLDAAARMAYLSPKQFERKFKDRTGVNPKLFTRLVKFDRAFREKNLKPHIEWKTIAYDTNYYDYQHLVRDYRDFTGMKPTEFHALEQQAPERLFGMAEHYYETQL